MRDFGKCEKIRKDTKIVLIDPGSSNNRSKFRLENPQRLEVRVIQVDDCVIKQGVRCDYLVITPSQDRTFDSQEIYIELKGSDVRHAVEQIATTIQKLCSNMSVLKLCFIASTRCPMNSTQIQNLKKKFRKKYNAKLTIKNGEITYEV